MSYASLLINTCTIQRYSEALPTDSYGVNTLTWADEHTDEACRLSISPRGGGGNEIKVGAELVVADYLLFLGDVDITEQDRVVIDSVTYEVLLVKDRQDGTGSHHKECFLRAIR